MSNEASMPVDVKVGIDTYLIALDALMAESRGDHRKMTASVRQKYAKVCQDGRTYSYVDLATGDVLKGNYKGVERAVIHIKRGNVCDGSWINWHGPYGIGYAVEHGITAESHQLQRYRKHDRSCRGTPGDGERAGKILRDAIADHKAARLQRQLDAKIP